MTHLNRLWVRLALAFLLLFRTLPVVLLSPFAGALVDRWDRRTTLILSDGGAARAPV